jgi:hypothetical protein
MANTGRRVIPPEEVTSPRRRWTLFQVIHNDGEGNIAIALGKWKGSATVGLRWNGKPTRPIGNPQSRGLATWFILPETLWDGVIATLGKKQREAANFFLKFTLDDVPKTARRRKR